MDNLKYPYQFSFFVRTPNRNFQACGFISLRLLYISSHFQIMKKIFIPATAALWLLSDFIMQKLITVLGSPPPFFLPFRWKPKWRVERTRINNFLATPNCLTASMVSCRCASGRKSQHFAAKLQHKYQVIQTIKFYWYNSHLLREKKKTEKKNIPATTVSI